MTIETVPFIIQVAAFILPVGIFYGTTNQRIKEAEKQIDLLDGLPERLARVEEKIDYIINNINKL